MTRTKMLLMAGIFLFLGSIGFELGPTEVKGAVPKMINFQGVLKKGSGQPVADGPYSVTFKIYDAAAGGNVLWTETQSVTTANGLFTALLGAVTPVPDSVFQDTARWLGIAVSPDPEMTPRQQLPSVGYGYRVSSVDGAKGGTINGNINVATGSVIFESGYGLHWPNGCINGEGPFLQLNGNAGIMFVGGATCAGVTEMFLDGATGKLGIGTVSPTERLQVAGTIYSTSGGFKFPDGTLQTTAATGGAFLPLTGGTMSGPIGNIGDPAITMGKGNFGTGNINDGAQAFVAGSNNRARGAYSVVGGGGGATAADSNSALGYNSTISGGKANKANGMQSTISGGAQNSASGLATAIGGGTSNTASQQEATVAGGSSNTASNAWSAVSGGSTNLASGSASTVGGGLRNSANNNYATIAGGRENLASGFSGATVGGGVNNTASGTGSTVSGGGGPDLGNGNTASGDYSTVPGGRLNVAAGNYSLASGKRARADHIGTFVWADSTEADFASTNVNQFLIRASGGVGIGTNSPGAMLDVNGSLKVGGGTVISKIQFGSIGNGTSGSTGTSGSVTFPTAFSSTPLVFLQVQELDDNGSTSARITAISTTGFSWNAWQGANSSAADRITWIAIGP